MRLHFIMGTSLSSTPCEKNQIGALPLEALPALGRADLGRLIEDIFPADCRPGHPASDLIATKNHVYLWIIAEPFDFPP